MSQARRDPTNGGARLWHRLVVNLVDLSRRTAILVVAGGVISTALFLAYIPSHLSLDTEPLHLLDDHFFYRQLNRSYERAFPQLSKLIVVVADAGTPSHAEAAVGELAAKLRAKPELFSSIYAPGEDPFFARHGALYMDGEALLRLDERLNEWAPFLRTVMRDPSLRGLFSVVGPAIDKTRQLAKDPSLGDLFSLGSTSANDSFNMENQARLTSVLAWMGDSVEAQLANRLNPLFWRTTMLEGLEASGTSHRRLLMVKPRLDYTSYQPAERPLSEIRLLADSLQDRHSVTIRLTGDVTIEQEERETVATGARIAAILSFILVSLIVLLGLRSFRLAASIAFTLVTGLVWTAAFATSAIGTLNVISATAPVLFIGLGVDFGIQFGMRYLEMRDEGLDHATALRRTAGCTSSALTLSAIAAALSFFAFLPTGYKGVAELGLIAGVGMFLALIANLTLLPALLTVFSVKPDPVRRPSRAHVAIGHLVPSHRRSILLCAVAALGAALAFIPFAKFDFNALHLKDPSSEGVVTFMELLDDPKNTPFALNVLASDQAAANRLTARLEALPEVRKAIGLGRFVPDGQSEKLAILDEMAFSLRPVISSAERRTPPTQAENLRAFAAFQRSLEPHRDDPLSASLIASTNRLGDLLQSLREGPDWPNEALNELQLRLTGELPTVREHLLHLISARHVSLEDLPSTVRERYIAPDGTARLVVFPQQDMRDNDSIRRFVESVQSTTPRVLGMPAMLLGAGDEVVKSCVQATGFALIGVTLLLLIVLRRLGDTILVLLPLTLTLALTIALSVALNLPLNFANVIALPLVLGLGIAFGIYLIMRAREGVSIDELILCSTCRAVWFSALTTIASFGTLAIADHRGMASMGLLLSVTLGICMLCTLVILPAVMAELESRGLWCRNLEREPGPGPEDDHVDSSSRGLT